MLKFHRKVNSKENLIGVYITTKEFDKHASDVYQFYNDLFEIEKKRAIIPYPLIMLVDPTLEDNHLSLKILNVVSAFLPKQPIFCELTYSYSVSDFQRNGLDVLFYGQEHTDTLSILSNLQDRSNEEIKEMMDNQKLLSNKALMQRNFDEVIRNLKECEDYI